MTITTFLCLHFWYQKFVLDIFMSKFKNRACYVWGWTKDDKNEIFILLLGRICFIICFYLFTVLDKKLRFSVSRVGEKCGGKNSIKINRNVKKIYILYKSKNNLKISCWIFNHNKICEHARITLSKHTNSQWEIKWEGV